MDSFQASRCLFESYSFQQPNSKISVSRRSSDQQMITTNYNYNYFFGTPENNSQYEKLTAENNNFSNRYDEQLL